MPLGPASDGTRHMQRGGLGSAARDNEGAEGIELGFAAIDRAFQLGDSLIIDRSLLELLPHFLEVGGREQRTEGKEITLDGHDDLVDARHHFHGADPAKGGIQLVDIAVRGDPWMVFRHAAAAKKAGVTGVAGAGVEAHLKTGNGKRETGNDESASPKYILATPIRTLTDSVRISSVPVSHFPPRQTEILYVSRFPFPVSRRIKRSTHRLPRRSIPGRSAENLVVSCVPVGVRRCVNRCGKVAARCS